LAIIDYHIFFRVCIWYIGIFSFQAREVLARMPRLTEEEKEEPLGTPEMVAEKSQISIKHTDIDSSMKM